MRQKTTYLLCTGARFSPGGIFSSLSNENTGPVHYILSRISDFKKAWLSLALFILCLSSYSQQNLSVHSNSFPGQHNLQQLGINEFLPDLTIHNITNHPTGSTRLSDLHGKYLLLDFFGTSCLTCIRSLPKMNQLKKTFEDQLEVMIVAYESKEKLEALKKKNKVFAANALPVVVGDSILHGLFPHKLLPHIAWIDREGKVKAITSSSEVTENHIRDFIEGRELNLPQKADVLDFNRNIPLLVNNNGGKEKAILSRSLFTSRLNGIPTGGGQTYHNDSTIKRIFLLNLPILSLFQSAIREDLQNRLVIRVKDSTRFFKPGNNISQWNDHNTFCYELWLPSTATRQEQESKMISDLNSQFKLNGRWEFRYAHCLVISKTGPIQRIQGKDSITLYSLVKTFNNSLSVEKDTILENQLRENVFVNKDLLNCKSLGDLQIALQRQGITATIQRKEIRVFVISEL